MKDAPASILSRFELKRWVGVGGLVTFLVVLAGRLVLEPVRGLPMFDGRAMDSYSAVEHFTLRQSAARPEVAFFGSSQTVWGIIPEVAAQGMGIAEHKVQRCGVVAGTPFDMLNLLRRNPENFQNLRIAVIELNPVMLAENREEEGRLRISISQHASLEERGRLRSRYERRRQVAEWFFPFVSVRRTLRSNVLNLADPHPGNPLCRHPDFHLYPSLDWNEGVTGELRERHLVPAHVGAKRMVGAGTWKVSKFQDHALREVLAWFADREVPVVIHQFPLHPEVMDLILFDPEFHRSYELYVAYLDGLKPLTTQFVQTQYPAECGTTEAGMADRMHLNERGARCYSLYLAKKVRETANFETSLRFE